MNALEIKSFTFGPFSENTFLLWDISGECVVIDPGCSNAAEQKKILAFLGEQSLTLKYILNTHCHLDHVWGNHFFKERFKVPLICPVGEEKNLEMAEVSAKLYGIPGFDPSPQPDRWVSAGEKISFGKIVLETLFTPGHTAGHIAFYHRDSKQLFSGDVLFSGSIGRTDFPGGSMPVLMNSIFNVLMPLGGETLVYSGHGPVTTLAEEKANNPFLSQGV